VTRGRRWGELTWSEKKWGPEEPRKKISPQPPLPATESMRKKKQRTREPSGRQGKKDFKSSTSFMAVKERRPPPACHDQHTWAMLAAHFGTKRNKGAQSILKIELRGGVWALRREAPFLLRGKRERVTQEIKGRGKDCRLRVARQGHALSKEGQLGACSCPAQRPARKECSKLAKGGLNTTQSRPLNGGEDGYPSDLTL